MSRLGLGTWTWGRETGLADAARQLRLFLDAGGNLVDTAAVYGGGAAERCLGDLLRTGFPRDDLVLATKAGVGAVPDTSRGTLLSTLDSSLRRLRVDHVDLWQVHVWSDATPLAETLTALDDAVRSGRCRYAGICNYTGEQAALAVAVQQDSGLAPLVSHQTQYSLLVRDPERDVVPAAAEHGTGVLAWSPLAGGVLTGKYRRGTPPGSRATDDHYAPYLAPFLGDEWAGGVTDAVGLVARALDREPAEVALAWVRDRACVAAALVGARTDDQLRTALRSESLDLPAEIGALLDEVSATG